MSEGALVRNLLSVPSQVATVTEDGVGVSVVSKPGVWISEGPDLRRPTGREDVRVAYTESGRGKRRPAKGKVLPTPATVLISSWCISGCFR